MARADLRVRAAAAAARYAARRAVWVLEHPYIHVCDTCHTYGRTAYHAAGDACACGGVLLDVEDRWGE